MVPGARIELATPAFSGRRSTNELPRLFNNLAVGKTSCVGFCVGFCCRNRNLAATFKLAGSLFEVGLVRNVISVKDAACFVARNRHADLLRYAATNELPDRTSSEVVHLQPLITSFSFAVRPLLDDFLSEAGPTTKRIPIFPRLGNAAAILAGK